MQPEIPATTPVAAKKPAAARAPAMDPIPAVALSASASEAVVPAVETEANTLQPKPAPVTITGCLERNDETFRLKDTAGADVPKSRSWKSGFLKKGSASIEVVDAAHRLKLPDHVGERVSVTGRLVDREMQVRSLQRVAAFLQLGGDLTSQRISYPSAKSSTERALEPAVPTCFRFRAARYARQSHR